MIFLVWLFHPASAGATTIYNTYILPNMKQYEKHIIALEKGVSNAAGAAKDKAYAAKDMANAAMGKGSSEDKTE